MPVAEMIRPANDFAVEFVGGPRSGDVIGHDYEAMPKFVMFDADTENLVPLTCDSIKLYMLAEDGRYHFLEMR